MSGLLKWGLVAVSGIIALGAVYNAKKAKEKAKQVGEVDPAC